MNICLHPSYYCNAEREHQMALIVAVQNGSTECARLLQDAGADMDAKSNVRV